MAGSASILHVGIFSVYSFSLSRQLKNENFSSCSQELSKLQHNSRKIDLCSDHVGKNYWHLNK